MEPAVKPAARTTRNGHIGVLATAGTFVSQRYADLMARFASGVTVLQDPCPGLVEQIEAGRLADPATEEIIRRAVGPMLAQGVDTLVLGCTHYPFVLPLIERVAGPGVTVIDPAPAVARQAQRLLNDHGEWPANAGSSRTWLLTTGDAAALAQQAHQLLGEAWPAAGLIWQGDDQLTWAAGSHDLDQSP
jgi:glutamate racemase